MRDEIVPSDCGRDPDPETLYAEGRSARAALDWTVACLRGDEERAAELMHPAFTPPISLTEMGRQMPFTDEDDFGAVIVEPAALDQEAVTVADLGQEDHVAPGEPFATRFFELLLEHDDEHGWRIRGFLDASALLVDGRS